MINFCTGADFNWVFKKTPLALAKDFTFIARGHVPVYYNERLNDDEMFTAAAKSDIIILSPRVTYYILYIIYHTHTFCPLSQ